MDYVKWKMTEKDMNAFIKNWQDCESTLDLLIIKQKIIHKKLLKEQKKIKGKVRE
jgi:uncharacterized protein YeeX (DUF496 family)